jgi:UDP-N-acetyl-D-glucosamine dehydrogenase
MDLCSDEAAMAEADCVVIVTDHSGFDYKALVEKVPLIVDTRNALKGVVSDKIVRL